MKPGEETCEGVKSMKSWNGMFFVVVLAKTRTLSSRLRGDEGGRLHCFFGDVLILLCFMTQSSLKKHTAYYWGGNLAVLYSVKQALEVSDALWGNCAMIITLGLQGKPRVFPFIPVFRENLELHWGKDLHTIYIQAFFFCC